MDLSPDVIYTQENPRESGVMFKHQEHTRNLVLLEVKQNAS
jgi:hypothetical protein